MCICNSISSRGKRICFRISYIYFINLISNRLYATTNEVGASQLASKGAVSRTHVTRFQARDPHICHGNYMQVLTSKHSEAITSYLGPVSWRGANILAFHLRRENRKFPASLLLKGDSIYFWAWPRRLRESLQKQAERLVHSNAWKVYQSGAVKLKPRTFKHRLEITSPSELHALTENSAPGQA